MSLKTDCLGVVPMSEEEVEQLYESAIRGYSCTNASLRALIRSHERLRAELLGSEILREETERHAATLAGDLREARAEFNEQTSELKALQNHYRHG